MIMIMIKHVIWYEKRLMARVVPHLFLTVGGSSGNIYMWPIYKQNVNHFLLMVMCRCCKSHKSRRSTMIQFSVQTFRQLASCW